MSNEEAGNDKQWMSFGKGGAGNLRKTSKALPSDGLETPPLKGENYSTGRGGVGNIAKNDPEKPELARQSQDVEAPPVRKAKELHHIGRGGAANTYIASEDEVKAAKGGQNGKGRTMSSSSSGKPKGIASLADKVVGGS